VDCYPWASSCLLPPPAVGYATPCVPGPGDEGTVTEPRDILRLPSLRLRPVLDRTMRWVTLLSFTVGAVGVPIAPAAWWSESAPRCARQPGQPCGCSAVSRTLGKCCCVRGAITTLSAGNASERQPEPNPGAVCSLRHDRGNHTLRPSCCAKKPATKPDRSLTVADQKSRTLSIEACGCGAATPSALMFLCGDPRVLPSDADLIVVLPARSELAAFDLAPAGQRPRPDVPPPKSLRA
jgi:hypothetical protein